MLNGIDTTILNFIEEHEGCSSGQIFDEITPTVSLATLKRILSRLISEKYLITTGQKKATRYYISPIYQFNKPINLQSYFLKETDERDVRVFFDFQKDVLLANDLFNERELSDLNRLQDAFLFHISNLSGNEFNREFERLAIDLSWKSSQIEGNTYSLLETEMLIKERIASSGKTNEEAVMLLNHKDALDFIVRNTDYLQPLTVSKIEDIHSILVKGLNVDRNLRRNRIGISGTRYRPPENEFQIREALEDACTLINLKENVFEKALLALVLISYIQPFMDGNKRTARIVSNSILINYKHCPLSYRTVDSLDYKKAMLLFYEQHNISAIKSIFMNQFEFAVKTYF